ncbi:MAG TPA: hypothetical protein VGI40_11785 [Pirellulaceae bacterium]
MPGSFVECSFLIPVCRDANLSDGSPHLRAAWQWLDSELFDRFGGRTKAPGEYHGFYRDPDTEEQVADESIRFFVAVPKKDMNKLRSLLEGACVIFAQKCIYLSIAGKVEFVELKRGNKN